MPMTFVKPEELDSYIGKSLEPSEWLTIDQERINNFADATNDHQFIHVDPEQAAPIFGSTIAHGFLSLSLTSGMGEENALVVEGSKMSLNYGLDKIRFLALILYMLTFKSRTQLNESQKSKVNQRNSLQNRTNHQV